MPIGFAAPLVVSDEDRATLERIARSNSLPHRSVRQAKALLWAAEGMANEHIARRLEADTDTVRTWRLVATLRTSGPCWHRSYRQGAGPAPLVAGGHGARGGPGHPARTAPRRRHPLVDPLTGQAASGWARTPSGVSRVV